MHIKNLSSLLALWQTWEARNRNKVIWIKSKSEPTFLLLLFNTFQCQWKCCDEFTFFTLSTANERVKVFSGMSSAAAATVVVVLLFVDFLPLSFSLALSLTQKRHFYHHHHTQQFQFELLFSAALLFNVLQQCTTLYPSVAIVSTNFQHLLLYTCIQRFHGFQVNLLFSITPKIKISSSSPLVWIETLAHTHIYARGTIWMWWCSKKYTNINAL